MDLPVTKSGNKHVVVFQDFLTKWPLVYPVRDQKAITIAKLLVEEVIPTFGVPEVGSRHQLIVTLDDGFMQDDGYSEAQYHCIPSTM